MKLTIDRAALLKTLAHVQSVVERRNTIPILSNVLMEVGDDKLSLTATDMDLTIVDAVAAEVAEPGATTVPAHTFYDIVRKLPDGARSRSPRPATARASPCKAGRSTFTLATLPREDFPAPGAAELPHAVRPGSRRSCSMLIDRTKLCHLDRGDALLPERHLPACRRDQRPAGAARGGHRRAPPGALRNAPARGRLRHAGRDRAAQDDSGAAQADRGERRGGRRLPVRHANPVRLRLRPSS